MYILGVCNDETSSACLMKDGVVVAAASEERFSRNKMDDSFPSRSIQFCLDFAGIVLNQLDAVAYSWSKGFPSDLLTTYIDRALTLQSDPKALEIFFDRIHWERLQDKRKKEEFEKWVEAHIDQTKIRVLDFYHHEAHAASASFLSPFDSGVVFTADGRGDYESTVIWRFDRFSETPLEKIYSAPSTDSFGFFYGRITGLLGFKPMRHEGKITGLAASGDSTAAIDLCRKMIEVEDGRVVGRLGSFYRPFFEPYEDELVEEVKSHKREDVASAAQAHLEGMMRGLLSHHLAEFDGPEVDLMCAGGVFGNVKVTQVLKKVRKIGRTYVQPQMGDGGLCLGAAALANEQLRGASSSDGRKTEAMLSMYLGPSSDYGNNGQAQAPSDVHDDHVSAQKIVDSLLEGKVIGLIQGRMEFGPRALCNRTILCRTSDSSINEWLNKRMQRTEFMPFAPVIRLERAAEAIVDFDEHDITLAYMTSTVEVSERFESLCPAVVHVDKTARPQIVSSESNPFIWQVLKNWETASGELSLVNTSFNVHEEPIVLSEFDGITALNNRIIDELWVSKGEEFHVYY